MHSLTLNSSWLHATVSVSLSNYLKITNVTHNSIQLFKPPSQELLLEIYCVGCFANVAKKF